jgi:hypothetical protein
VTLLEGSLYIPRILEDHQGQTFGIPHAPKVMGFPTALQQSKPSSDQLGWKDHQKVQQDAGACVAY